eukprot:2591428-Rhodomonas_salina.1
MSELLRANHPCPQPGSHRRVLHLSGVGEGRFGGGQPGHFLPRDWDCREHRNIELDRLVHRQGSSLRDVECYSPEAGRWQIGEIDLFRGRARRSVWLDNDGNVGR